MMIDEALQEKGREAHTGRQTFLFFLTKLIEWPRWALHMVIKCFFLRPNSTNGQLRPTAWLDGLRGFAALIVYFHHNQAWTHLKGSQNIWFEMAYGYNDEYFFSAMHGIRTFFSGGHYAVAVFFVISGYVLAVRTLQLIHRNDLEALSKTLGSALFRRWLRLFLPVLGTTFIWMTTWHAFGWFIEPFEPQPTYLGELGKWFREVVKYMYIYDNNPVPWLYWNLHTWSIPHEFRGSLAIYTVCLGLATVTRTARLFCVSSLIFYFLYVVDAWHLATFLSGMLLCDIDLLSTADALPRTLAKISTILAPVKKPFFTILFLLSVYLGGVPLSNDDWDTFRTSPGWSYLAWLKPAAARQHKWFFLFYAATFLVAAVPRLPWLKAFFNTSFCQYLGRVSYSLYLVHGPMIWTFGNLVYQVVGFERDEVENAWYWNLVPLNTQGPLGFEPAFWIAQLVVLPATLWVANLATVMIDEPSVRFAKWVLDSVSV